MQMVGCLLPAKGGRWSAPHRDGLCQTAADDVGRQVVDSGSKPAEHKDDEEDSAQDLAAGISGQPRCLHEDVIHIMDQEHHAAHFHGAAHNINVKLEVTSESTTMTMQPPLMGLSHGPSSYDPNTGCSATYTAHRTAATLCTTKLRATKEC